MVTENRSALASYGRSDFLFQYEVWNGHQIPCLVLQYLIELQKTVFTTVLEFPSGDKSPVKMKTTSTRRRMHHFTQNVMLIQNM
jgi:hypothetical protein